MCQPARLNGSHTTATKTNTSKRSWSNARKPNPIRSVLAYMATGMYFGTAYGTYVRRGKAASSRESVRFGAGLRNCLLEAAVGYARVGLSCASLRVPSGITRSKDMKLGYFMILSNLSALQHPPSWRPSTRCPKRRKRPLRHRQQDSKLTVWPSLSPDSPKRPRFARRTGATRRVWPRGSQATSGRGPTRRNVCHPQCL